MSIFFEIVIIVAYFFNGTAGMLAMLTYSIAVLLFSQKTMLHKLLELMAVSLPMAYIGIGGIAVHQFYSWYNLFLLLFLFTFIWTCSFKLPFKIYSVAALFFIMFCLLVNVIWTESTYETFTEIAQVFVMILPLSIIHAARSSFPISKEEVYGLIYRYVDFCIATAACMLLQYLLYSIFKRQVGIINFTGNGRISCYCLFKGASILPIYMGIGIIFLYLECFEKRITLDKLIKIGIIFSAVVLNSSRTALLMLTVVLIVVTWRYLRRAPSFKGFLIAALGFATHYLAINFITARRGRLAGFLDANGRMETWINGIDIWLVNIKNFFFGEGFSGERWIGISKPHNLIIQTLSQCGVLITVVVMAMIVKYLTDNRQNIYRYIPWYILLSGMLVTDFYANAFTTVIFMLVDLYGGANTSTGTATDSPPAVPEPFVKNKAFPKPGWNRGNIHYE